MVRRMKPVLIFGAGQVAQVFAAYLDQNYYDVAAFVVDAEYMVAGASGIPVVLFDAVEKLYRPEDYTFTVGMSFRRLNSPRSEKFDAMRLRGYEPLTFIDHRASVLGPTRIGPGSFIMDENTIQPYAEIGENTIVWSGNHIGHHSKVGNNVFIASHAVISGAVEIGDYSFIGVNATIRDGVKIGKQLRDRRRQPDPFRLRGRWRLQPRRYGALARAELAFEGNLMPEALLVILKSDNGRETGRS
jgi:sugar O-acyltransferase (sialic acid O-acetyltransferase NeuD family)